MSYPSAPGTFPALTESILGPVLIGLTTITSHDSQLIDDVWRTAADSVPTTLPVLNVLAGKATQPQKHQRRVLTAQGTDYLKLAQLCDVRSQESSDESWKRWRWMVAAKVAPDDAARQLVGQDRTPIRIDVTAYRLQAGMVLGAQQLALFRHYVVIGFRALDPSLVVLGGQHDWQDNWWPIAGQASQLPGPGEWGRKCSLIFLVARGPG
jgi:hypothetical protein